MPEHLKPSPVPPQQSHAQSLRDDALRRLSRSPHPYHRQKLEIPHASERFSSPQSPLRSRHNTDDEDQDNGAFSPGYNASTNSDSGTEADDEHFLKGLPAPKIRPHKGLRGLDGTLSGSPSPLLSPAILDDDTPKEGYLRRTTLPTTSLKESDARKVAEKFRQKRRVEVIRRVSEAGILGFVTGLLCLSPEVRQLIWLWRRGRFQASFPLSLANECRTGLSIRHHDFSRIHIPVPITTAYKPRAAVEEALSNSDPRGFRSSTVALPAYHYIARLLRALDKQPYRRFAKHYTGYIFPSTTITTFFGKLRKFQCFSLVSFLSTYPRTKAPFCVEDNGGLTSKRFRRGL
jgi:hypothetical protein